MGMASVPVSVGMRVSGVAVGMGIARAVDVCTHQSLCYASAGGNAARCAACLRLIRQFDTALLRGD